MSYIVNPKVYVSGESATLPIRLQASPIQIQPTVTAEEMEVQYTIQPQVTSEPILVYPVLENDDMLGDIDLEVDEGGDYVTTRGQGEYVTRGGQGDYVTRGGGRYSGTYTGTGYRTTGATSGVKYVSTGTSQYGGKVLRTSRTPKIVRNIGRTIDNIAGVRTTNATSTTASTSTPNYVRKVKYVPVEYASTTGITEKKRW